MNYKLFLVISIVVVLGGAIGYLNESNVHEAVQDVATFEEELVNPHLHLLEDEDAVAAAQAVINKKVWESDLKAAKDLFAEKTAVYEADKAVYLEEKERLEKLIGSYWKDERNIKAYIRQVFPEEPNTAVAVGTAESKLRMVQSNERYTFTDPSRGIYKGERERSYCIFQIHAPDHDDTAQRLGLHDYRTNVESCIKLARVVYDQRKGSFNPWSVYKNKTYLVYVK